MMRKFMTKTGIEGYRAERERERERERKREREREKAEGARER